MKKLALVYMVLVAASCTRSIFKTSPCKDYRKSLVTNWVHGSDGVYQFKGSPKFWHKDIYPTYINEGCLLGLTKKQIAKLFGQPTKTYTGFPSDLFVYCMDESCLKIQLYGGNALYFEFKDGKVSGIFSSPGTTGIPD